MARRLGLWWTDKIVALERGDRFDEWTFRGSTWEQKGLDDYDHELMNFRNGNGATNAVAAWRKTYATLGLSNPTGYTASHTVSVRVKRSNRTSGIAIGPATALHASAGSGNGYVAQAMNVAGTPTIKLRKLTNGVIADLATIAEACNEGDVLSLCYRYNTGTTDAELIALVNGSTVLSHSDAGGYDMATLTALPGMYGDTDPAIPVARTVGHWTNEWWVTDVSGTYREPAARYPGGTGEILLRLMQRQRYTDSATPLIQRLISGQLLRCAFTVNRIGGCGDMRVSFRYPHVFQSSGSSIEHAEHELFHHPQAEDWNDANWFGGEAVLLAKWKPNDDAADSEIVWRGRVARITLDPETKEISVEGHGLVQALDDVVIHRSFDQIKVSEIIKTIIRDHASKSGASDRRDIPINYNASKIVGVGAVLEQEITITFNHTTALSAMREIAGFLPGGVIWGVDRDGDFYLDQQVDTYDNDMSGAGFVTYVVDKDGVRFERDLDFSRIHNEVTVTGREAETTDGEEANQVGRIVGSASCERSQELWSKRAIVENEGSVTDIGLLGKVALARCKEACFPDVTGRLSVVQRIVGQRSFFSALTRFAPRVGVIDRPQIDVSGRHPIGYVASFSSAGPSSLGTSGYRVGPHTLRRFGDNEAFAFGGKGSLGAQIELASITTEQILDRSWSIRCALRFDYAHPGGVGDIAYMFGRNGGTTATDYGWGGLWWSKTGAAAGTLLWYYTSSTGSVRLLATTISVPPAGGTTVRFTIHRDASGVFRVYNGTTLVATESGWTGDTLQNDSAPWRWFRHDSTGLAANFIHGDFAFDQWYLHDTGLGNPHHIEGQVGGFASFLSRNDNVELRRCDAAGLLMYMPAKGQAGDPVPVQRGLPSTLYQATVSSTANVESRDPVTDSARVGQLVTDDAALTKRWGGAQIYEVESCTYEVEPSIGVVRKNYTLGTPKRDAIAALASVQEQIRRVEEIQRRTTRDLP